MAGQAALPGHEDLPEALPGAEVVVRLVEDAVPEACAHDRADEEGVEEGVHQVPVHLLTGEEPFEEIPADDETGYEQEAVPADLDRSDMEKDGVEVPVDG